MNAMAKSSLSKIDIGQLKALAEECGVREDDLTIPDRILNRRPFMVKLHASLYSVVLGILDDVLANTKIRVLSDEITFDVVASNGK